MQKSDSTGEAGGAGERSGASCVRMRTRFRRCGKRASRSRGRVCPSMGSGVRSVRRAFMVKACELLKYCSSLWTAESLIRRSAVWTANGALWTEKTHCGRLFV